MLDTKEYVDQIMLHREMIKKIFDYEPTNFRNTELIYDNKIGEIIRNLGYKSIVIEDAWWNEQAKQGSNDTVFVNKPINLETQELDYIKINRIQNQAENSLKIILRDANTSDGIMFIDNDPNRLGDAILHSNKKHIGTFTDYEFLGEHNSVENGAFKNLDNQIALLIENNCKFETVDNLSSDVDSSHLLQYDCQKYSSWGHVQRDITVWRGGEEQEIAFAKLTQLHNILKDKNNSELMTAWRRFSTSCHFYFLGNKKGADKDFVDLFSPYQNTTDALEKYISAADSFLLYSNLRQNRHSKPTKLI
jgi:alpha-amylase